MGNDKRIKTVNVGNLKTPLENAKDVKVDTSTLAKWKASTQATQKISLDPNKTKANLENAGKINKPSIGAISQNKKNANAKQNGQTCSNFCRKLGLQILPLRYSVAQTKAPQLPTLLGKNVKSVALSYSKYTTEMIDSGYIYAMVKRKKGFQWMGYLVTPMGYLSSFPLDKPAPVTVQEFACKGNEHAFFASFVTVEYIAENLAEKIYIIYTHAPITKAKREEYQGKADEYVSSGKWQRVDVAAWAGGTSQQEHCLNDTTLKLAVNQSSSFGSDRWTKIVAKFAEKPKAYASIALYDPIGITLKLNEYRNEAYAPVDDYLEKKDANGVSNQRKLDAVQRLDTLKSSVVETIKQSNEANELNTRIPLDGILQSQLATLDEVKAIAQKRGDSATVARVEARKQELIKQQNELIERRKKNNEGYIGRQTQANLQVCEDNINFKEAVAFKKEAVGIMETALKVANQRAQEHLSWINAESLIDALDAYDDKDLQSGCAFKAHVASMLFGMEGATKAAEQIDNWIKKPEFERKNLFIRGLYSNQLEAKAKHDDAKKYATDFTAVGIKATKTIADFLKKTDSAWDEWARNQHKDTVDKNKGNLRFYKPEKKLMLYVSNFSRVVFRAGMGSNAESRFVRAISQKLLFAQMGELAATLRFDQVVHNIDPEKQKIGNNQLSPEFSQRIAGQVSKVAKEATIRSLDVLIDDAQVKSKQVALKLEEIEKIGSKGMANHTNNYHQVRASGILVLLEAINLSHMLNSGKYKDGVQIAAIVASVSALMAFGLDIFYGLAKGAREAATQTSYAGAGAAATRGAANIQRAGIKWAAGSLSAFAGGITAWLDYKKAMSLSEKVGVPTSLIVMYSVRSASGIVGFFLGIFAALTYIGPLMNYLKRVGASPFIQKFGTRLILTNLTEEAIRVFLLRGVAWVSGIGLILTVVEVSILIYMEWNKLERWCEHSTFRKDKSNKLMHEKQEAEDYQALFA